VHLPMQLQGTVAHPAFRIGSRNSPAPSDTVDLGALFASLPATLAFIDPTLTKDTDCVALLAEASNPQVRDSSVRAAH
jgi:hypothetical protein